MSECPDCKGKGKKLIIRHCTGQFKKCEKCNGTGAIKVASTIKSRRYYAIR